jgi:hypothetical protein
MGDRALIQLTNASKEFSPVLYLHWDGSRVGEIIYNTQERMRGRTGDLEYSFARLVQQAMGDCDGNTSVGVWNADKLLTAKDGHGDAGCFVVDIQGEDWVVHAGGGYGIEDNTHNLPIWELP